MSRTVAASTISSRRTFLHALSYTPAAVLLRAESSDLAPEAIRDAFNVRAFGAKGDGKTLDTKAIQAAIDACSKAGGGIVYFPTGGVFLTGTIYLKDHVNLHVATEATILGSRNLADYGTDTGVSSYYPEPLDRCLIYAKDASDVQLTGNGRIVGRSSEDHDSHSRLQPAPGAKGREAQQRPMLIRFENCNRIGISGLSLQRCWAWCVHLKNSRDIFLRNVRIDNDRQDGFHLESSENAAISDCHLACGDDAIVLTTSSPSRPVRNVTVTNCLLRSRWAGIRFGPLSKGNFENITVSNCVIYDCNGGGIKLGMYEGAEIRNCVFENLVMDQVSAPISIFLGTWPDIGSTITNPPMMPLGKIHHLQFRGIRAITKAIAPGPRPDESTTMFFQGHPHSSIEEILLSDIQMTFAGGGTAADAKRRDIIDMDRIDYRKGGYWTDNKNVWGIPPAYGLYGRHLKGLRLDNVQFDLAKPDLRAPVFCSDSEDVEISRFEAACEPAGTIIVGQNDVGMTLSSVRPAASAEAVLRLEGEASRDVFLFGNDARHYSKLVEYGDGAKEADVIMK